MKKFLLTLEEEQDQILQKEMWQRNISIPDIPSKINVLTGMRRTGKTTILYQHIKNLLKNGVPRSRILFINFEDDRMGMNSLKSNIIADAVETWYSIDPSRHEELCYLFFDEIQNVSGWEKTVRRIHDTKKVRLYLTGSSAKLLSKEIATELRGRSITTEVWPLDFEEYPGFEKFPASMGRAAFDRYLFSFFNYMKTGGFPETVGADRSDAVQILQEYVEVVLFRDVMERWSLANLPLLKELFRRLLSMPGRMLSVNKLYNELKGLGFSISKNTLYEYILHVEDAYLIFTVPLYSQSVKQQTVNPRKVYAIDTGLLNSVNLLTNEDMGYLFENIIFLALRKKGYKVFYYFTKERYEVDFFAENAQGRKFLVQACFDYRDAETLKRETRSLELAKERTGIQGMIVTPENYLEFIRNL
jgi:uncharacterized protein